MKLILKLFILLAVYYQFVLGENTIYKPTGESETEKCEAITSGITEGLREKWHAWEEPQTDAITDSIVKCFYKAFGWFTEDNQVLVSKLQSDIETYTPGFSGDISTTLAACNLPEGISKANKVDHCFHAAEDSIKNAYVKAFRAIDGRNPETLAEKVQKKIQNWKIC
uniref:Putative secreted protein n=1 Tax=Corethrella appendiculata TaxID=1370023 RepID=U5EF08_9DIPT